MGRIVIGFDGTDCAEDALAFGVRLAAATGDEPVVVAVHPESPAGMGHVDAEWVAAMREQGEHILSRARALLVDRSGVDYRVVGSSSAAHGLADVAEDLAASTIVLGSGRRGALRRTATGSTIERLLHGTLTSVTVVPRGYRSIEHPPVEAVGCAFVDTPDGHEALWAAVELTRRAGARLRVFTAVAPVAEFSTYAGPETERAFTATARAEYQRALDAAVAAVAEVSDTVPVSGELLEGGVSEALAALDPRDVDVLVCGSRRYGPIRRVLLGGASGRLVRMASCPVMVVPRSGAPERSV